MPEYAKLIDTSIKYGKEHGKNEDDQIDAALDRLLVEFGREILQIVPGKVSTEVDARFSFSTEATVAKALHIIDVRLFVGRTAYKVTNTTSSCTRTVSYTHLTLPTKRIV